MTQIATTAGQWNLTGIDSTTGQCDCCSRRITQRVFQVEHPQHGTALLGRRCAAKATGYAATAIEREQARALRMAEMDRRHAIVAAEYPDLAAAEYGTADWDLFSNAYTNDYWWTGRGWAAFPTYQAYIAHYLTRR